MSDTKPDPRATILDIQRQVEHRLRAILPAARATLAAGAKHDRFSGPIRADLAWMADMVSELEQGAPVHQRDAVAFVSAARRVVGALNRIADRSWPARLERLWYRALWVSLILGGAGAVVAGVLFLGMFWVGPPTPAGYDAVMTGAFYLGLGGLAGCVGLALLEWIAVAAAVGLKWARRHPVRAGIWLTGLPLIGVFTYALTGLAGLVVMVGLGVAAVFWENGSIRARPANLLHHRGPPWNPTPEIHYGMDPLDAQLLGHHDIAESRGL